MLTKPEELETMLWYLKGADPAEAPKEVQEELDQEADSSEESPDAEGTTTVEATYNPSSGAF